MTLPEPSQIELSEVALAFVGAGNSDRTMRFSALVSALRQAVVGDEPELAAAALRQAVVPTLDYTTAQALVRLRRTLTGRVRARHKLRIAILGSFTTTQLVALLDLFLFAAGVEAEFYESDFGVFRQEIIDPTSTLYAFRPEILLIATTRRDLGRRPDPGIDAVTEARLLEVELGEWTALWKVAQRTAGCQVIQNNFVIPAARSLANREPAHVGSLGRFISEMNRALALAAPSFVTVHDVDHLAASWGRWLWDDPRFFHHAKLPCDPEFLVDYAHSVASLVGAQLGLAKKCLVLDLDNTLWGGVIGDDGLDGIRLGQGTPEGEAFVEFQAYAKSLRDRGILLAVCSKNNEATALEVFDRHTEMVLRRGDISCFVANWDDKATNLRRIAKALNIGIDSLVFADDNPAERAIVRQLAPEVAVPELSDDVTTYVRTLEQHRYFQVLSVAAEDLKRTEFYQADALRRDVQAAAGGDLDTFLRSLEMVAQIGPVTPMSLERSAQLIQRSNQFNLTTRRRSVAELTALLPDGDWITRTISLADRFGDNGLISVIIARVDGEALDIDTWLMSCRVLRRGVEPFVLNDLARVAQGRGLKKIRGAYVPTPKNQLVRDHYAGLGFAPAGQTAADGTTLWELSLGDGWSLRPHFIKELNHGQKTN